MNLVFFIAWRFSRGAKQQRFASFVSWFSTLGITLGVASLIIVMSVMNGFEAQLKQRILNLVPHLSISEPHNPTSTLKDYPHSPLIAAEVVLQSATGLQAALLQGIDPSLQADAVQIQQQLRQGRLTGLAKGDYGIILGAGIARALEVNLGDVVRVMATDTVVYSPLGELPAQRNFTVKGVYEFGSEVDQQFALTHIDDTARLLRTKRENRELTRYFLDDPFEITRLAKDLDMQGIEYSDWRDLYGEFFEAVKMERTMMSVLFFLIVAVAAFNILSSLMMLVGEKRGDVAILQTLGLNRRQLLSVFMLQGAWSGCVGALVGAVFGCLMAVNINGILSVLGLNFMAAGGQSLPVIIFPQDILVLTLGAMLLSIVATIYPAWGASRVSPAEALRYE